MTRSWWKSFLRLSTVVVLAGGTLVVVATPAHALGTPAPSGVQATSINPTTIRVSWTDNTSGLAMFDVFNGVITRSAAAGTTSMDWAGLAPGTYMCFQVRAWLNMTPSEWAPPGGGWACTTTMSPPAAPTGQTATATSTSTIRVGWIDNSTNETGFQIYNGITTVAVGTPATSYTWGGLAPGTYMCFSVRAVNAVGSSAWTPYACTTTPTTTVPAAPTGQTATVTSGSTIRVGWIDNSTNETGFQVYNGVTTVAVGANATSYTWGGLAPGTYMCFSVRAVNSAGPSAWTPYACTTIPTVPAAPSGQAASATGSSSIRISWSDNSNNETGFLVNNGTTIATLGANTTSYTWGGLAPSTYMCFTILAFNVTGPSAWSSQACTTTLPAPPPLPTGLAASAINSHTTLLTWGDLSGGGAQYAVSNGVVSYNTGAGATTFRWDGQLPNNYMCFTIRAFNAGGSSDWTTYRCTTTPQRTCSATRSQADAAGYLDLYHGTGRTAAQSIVSQGINLSLGDPGTDFGRGFYVTTIRSQAEEWARRNYASDPAVVHFRILRSNLTPGSLCGLVFPSADTEFLGLVKWLRTVQPAMGGVGYDFVEGPLLLNPSACIAGQTCITGGQQDSIHSQGAATVLNNAPVKEILSVP